MLPITSKPFDDLATSELHDILRLRSEVFVREQQCAYDDIDGLDDHAGTVHHWIEIDGHIAAYARELRINEQVTRIGRVVTGAHHRGIGLAARLVRHIRDAAHTPIELAAQTYLVEWYEALGFEIAGPEYLEDGIPHVPMRSMIQNSHAKGE